MSEFFIKKSKTFIGKQNGNTTEGFGFPDNGRFRPQESDFFHMGIRRQILDSACNNYPVMLNF
jgi:hypothetical protein